MGGFPFKSPPNMYKDFFFAHYKYGANYIHLVYIRSGFPQKTTPSLYNVFFFENVYTYKSPCMYTEKVYIWELTYNICRIRIGYERIIPADHRGTMSKR